LLDKRFDRGGNFFGVCHMQAVTVRFENLKLFNYLTPSSFRMAKLRVALGGEAGTANWIAPKPKGMWHRTYERKQFEIWWCKNQADLLFIGKYSHLLSQSEMDGLFGA
jgi:hypothetical protein